MNESDRFAVDDFAVSPNGGGLQIRALGEMFDG